METTQIKLDIEERISEIDHNLTNYWGRPFFKGILDDDIDSLEIILKMTLKWFSFSRIFAMFLLFIIYVLSLIAFFEIIKVVNLITYALLIICALPNLMNAYRFYQIKVNLENKIYLLRLLGKMNH